MPHTRTSRTHRTTTQPPDGESAAVATLRKQLLERVNRLNEIGVALSSMKNPDMLLETILLGAKALTNSDAGTLYTVTENQTLKFQILRTDSLNIAQGGTTGVPIKLPELPLYRHGKPNLAMVAAYTALKEETVNIPDAYEAEGFDFSGMRAFDAAMNYRSKSFLTVPLKNHENELIGVLQLINATDPESGEIRPFSPEDQQLAESLASQAAIALTNQRLIADLKKLFESFIQTIATAIDEKSPYTGGHGNRVPILSEMIAKAAKESMLGDLKDFDPTDDEMYEIRIAAWMHDCGKVVTPEYVVDKATKLETIYDRIHTISTRFEVLKRDAEIEFLNQKLAIISQYNGSAHPAFVQLEAQHAQLAAIEQAFHDRLDQLEDDRRFIMTCNVGGENMSPEMQNRVKEIAQYRWWNPESKSDEPFLSETEVYNLCIPKGTLTKEERAVINNHVTTTKKMLTTLPFPKNLRRVPEIAGSHHETMIGTGYPDGLVREQMSIPARIMAVADVFEALTASDRPYKPAKSLSESLKILGFMKKDQHIDPDLFDVFIRSKIYQQYAEKYLDPSQIDVVDESKIPGYAP
ncbi:MAG: GAF domain-containing protein [Magnetococcales bacterium]|nr:GAF domain-containing protein [Magnetococcales bacterium]